MSGFLEKLASRIAGRRDRAVSSFEALVRAVADDKPPTAEAAEAVLADAGRTAEQLSAAVQRLKDRRAAAVTLKRGQGAKLELETVLTKVAAVNAAHQAAVEKLVREHAEAVAALQVRALELERQVKAADQAAQVLRETANRDATAEREAELQEQLAEAKKRRDEALRLAHKAGRAAQDAGTAANHASTMYGRDYRQQMQEKSDAAAGEEADWLRKAEPHAARCRELEGELAQLEEGALTP